MMDTSGLMFPKHTPAVLEREEKKRTKKTDEEAFKAAVWARDKGRDRATGKPLRKQSPDPDERGHVHHLRGRRVMPEWKLDPKRACLLSATNHDLTDALFGKLLKIIGTDASKPLTFVRFNARGRELWRHVS